MNFSSFVVARVRAEAGEDVVFFSIDQDWKGLVARTRTQMRQLDVAQCQVQVGYWKGPRPILQVLRFGKLRCGGQRAYSQCRASWAVIDEHRGRLWLGSGQLLHNGWPHIRSE